MTERARLLAELSEEERKSAYERYEMLRPCLEDGVSQAEIARREQISLKNILAAKSPDINLQPDDILFVPTSTARKVATRTLETIVQTASGMAIYRGIP